jgi:hypothetical protein
MSNGVSCGSRPGNDPTYEAGARPGGTLEKIFEVQTWAQLGEHGKPCGLLDPAGYYDSLVVLFDHIHGRKGFPERGAPGDGPGRDRAETPARRLRPLPAGEARQSDR